MITALRTPGERFTAMPGFPWAPHYIDDLPGVATSLAAKAFWANAWQGESFMAWGAADPVFGGR